jgi:uncharacterized protein
MTNDELPILGVGLGFRPPFLSDLFLNRTAVDFLEVMVDHYLEATPQKEEELLLLAAHFPLIPHGLNLSLGSAEGLDRAYLRGFASVVNRIRPPWWSEHLAYTRAGGVEIGHLTPLPYTWEAIEVVCRNIATARNVIEAPLILENITYAMTLPGAEMTEAEFLTEVVERTNCGLLLDITNLYTNAINHGDDIGAFLDAIPLEKIVQLHFAGGEQQQETLIDSHSRPTPPPVWELMETVLRRTKVKGMILERDEDLPTFPEIVAELAQAREIGRRCRQWG